MSLILDALNKADQERNQNEKAPGINTIQSAAQTPAPKKRVNIPIIMGCTGIIVAGLAYWLGSHTTEQEPQSTREESSQPSYRELAPTPTPAPGATSDIAPADAPESADPQEKALADAKEKLETLHRKRIAAQYAQAQAADEPPARPTTVNKTPPKKKDKPLSSAVLRELQAIEAERQREEQQLAALVDRSQTLSKNNQASSAAISKKAIIERIDSNAPPTPLETPSANEAPTISQNSTINNDTANNDVGAIRDLPNTIQNQIPTIIYSKHNYKIKGKSSVTLNKKSVKEGGRAGQGLRVEKILEDGVIIRYKNSRFKMRALASWINM